MKYTEEEKQKLLSKAIEEYPRGTNYYSAYSGSLHTSSGQFRITSIGDIMTTNCEIEAIVYDKNKNKWGEIISKPKTKELIYEIY